MSHRTSTYPVSIGHINVLVDGPYRQEEALYGTFSVSATTDLAQLPLHVDGTLFQFVWNDDRLEYERVLYDVISLFSGEVDVDAKEQTHVPFRLVLPDVNGTWALDFHAAGPTDVTVSQVGGQRLYASGPTYAPPQRRLHDGAKSMRVCSYNVLACPGWPKRWVVTWHCFTRRYNFPVR